MAERRLKLHLVFPRFRYRSGDPPLGLALLAAITRQTADADVAILDATFDHSFDRIASRFDAERPDIVGIYFDSIMYNDGVRVARMARERRIFTVVGGPHATVLPETLVHEADLVVLGEGDETLPEIVRKFPLTGCDDIRGLCFRAGGEVRQSSPREFVRDLDRLPFPKWDLLDMGNYLRHWNYLDSVDMRRTGTTVIASRGCPFGCTYCQPTLRRLFGPKLRMRNPENVVAELAELKARYKVNGVFFHDDTLTARRGWVLEFCDRLERERLDLLWACNTRANTLDEPLMRRMHAVGLRNLHLGIESGSERILREVYRKGIELDEVRRVVDCARRVGVTVLGFFMLGAPTETPNEVERTIRFARSLRLDEATFAITSPLPGTYLHDRIAGDVYPMSVNFADFDYYSQRAFEDPRLPYAKLKLLHVKALLWFYLHPYRWPYILRHLLSVAGWRKLIQKVRRYA